MPRWTSPPRPTTRCGRCWSSPLGSRAWSRSTRSSPSSNCPESSSRPFWANCGAPGLVRSQRGADGGYALALPASEITLGAVIRAVDGPLAEVRGLRPHETTYTGVAAHLPEVWVAVRAALRHVLDETTLQQVLTGRLPSHVRRMIGAPDAWLPR